MINIYLCDDSKYILQNYQKLLNKLAEKHDLKIKITTFSSGEQLMFNLAEKPHEAEIIYLDILMGKTNGIETAKQLRAFGCQAEIIFLTSLEEYVFDSFDAYPMHYLLKDSVTLDKFEEVFLKAISLCEKKEREVFLCETGSVTRQIPLDSISHFEVRNRIITVHFDNDEFGFYSSMEKLEKELEYKNFIRVHRSFMIHLKYVDKIEKDSITLVTGDIIPLGTTYAKAFKFAFSRYLTS